MNVLNQILHCPPFIILQFLIESLTLSGKTLPFRYSCSEILLRQSTSKVHVTAVCLVAKENVVIIGRSDGSIIITDAVEAFQDATLQIKFNAAKSSNPIRGVHFDKINLIFYPFEFSEKYDSDLIWIGSDDYSVSLWSISLKCCLTSFYNHAAPIIEFRVCPVTSGRANGTVYSIDKDGGFCLLSPREQICLLSDAGNRDCITDVRWTLDGFLFILRNDHNLSVFDSYAMTPERSIAGARAQEIFVASAINAYEAPVPRQRPLLSLKTSFGNVEILKQERLQKMKILKSIQIHFDIEILIQILIQNYRITPNLLAEIRANERNNNIQNKTEGVNSLRSDKIVEGLSHGISTGFQLFKNVESKMRQKAVHKLTPTHSESHTPESVSPTVEPSRAAIPNAPLVTAEETTTTLPEVDSFAPLALEYCFYLLSCMHSWGLDQNLDTNLEQNGILKSPSGPLLFGFERKNSDILACSSNCEKSDLSDRWRINDEITFTHQLTITSISNAIVSFPELDSEKRQIWSHMMTLHCIMLPDLVESFLPPRIEVLARKWSDKILEIREAAQSLLLDLLRRIEQSGREKLMNIWYTILDDELRIEDENSLSNPRVNTSVVILGVMGAEFDCLGYRTRIISEKLTNLLSAKDSSIAKRTAVELVGRGFRFDFETVL